MENLTTSAWLNISKDDSVFYQLHVPNKTSASSIGVVIISPMGPEYMYCRRTIKCLSQKLAQQGFYTLRYDPIGMGNSSSDLYDPSVIEKWVATPAKLSQHLKQSYHLNDVVFIGLRSGSFILSELLKREKVNQAIYWFPYVNGKAWVRDLNLVDSMLKLESNDSGMIDGGGYPLMTEAQAQVSQINLNQNSIKDTKSLLLIEDSKSLPNKKLASVLEGYCQLEKRSLPGMKAMLQQATLSVVPNSNLDEIVQWIASTNQDDNHPSHLSDIHLGETDLGEVDLDKTDEQYESKYCVEKALVIPGEKNLYGILCEPKSSDYQDILLLTNAGSGHHVGPNRLNTDIARRAAELNMASYRFDLGHLGESTHDDGTRDNHPYAESSYNDVLDVIEFLSEHHKKNIILVGLCSAGHNFFHAAIASKNKQVKKLVIINPLTFYYKKGNSIFTPQDSSRQIKGLYHSEQALKGKKLSEIITNKKMAINAIKFIIFYIIVSLRKNFVRLMFKLGISPQDRLDKDLFKLKDKDIQLTFLCSDTDPGYHVITNQAPVFTNRYQSTKKLDMSKMIGSDHTFSSAKSREQLIDLLMDKLRL